MNPKTFLRLVIESFVNWLRDNAIHHAAALAFFTIFSLAPLVILTVGVAEFMLHQTTLESRIVALTEELIGQQVAGMVAEVVQNDKKDMPRSGVIASLIGLGVTIFGASLVFRELQNSLNVMWGLGPKPVESDKENLGRNLFKMVQKYFITIAAALSIGFLSVFLLLIMALGTTLSEWVEPVLLFGSLTRLIIQLIGFIGVPLLFMVIFALVFKFLPQAIIRWRDVWPGAALTAVLFWFSGYAVGLYLIFNPLSVAYGAAGTLIIFLLWMFASAAIVLYGAKFTQMYAMRFGVPIRPKEGAVLKSTLPIAEPGLSESLKNRQRMGNE